MRYLASCLLCVLFTVNATIAQVQNSTFGNFNTPKGKLKILVVCVSRMGERTINEKKIIIREQDDVVPNWPNGTGDNTYTTLPTWKDDLFYTSFDQFSEDVYSDTNLNNMSNYFYQMSGGQFEVIAEFFPERLVVGGQDVNYKGDGLVATSSLNLTAAVDSLEARIQQLQADTGYSFNFASFDNRIFSEKFKINNTTDYVGDSIIDNKIDFTLFIIRSGSTNGGALLDPQNHSFLDENDVPFSTINYSVFGSGTDGNSNIMRHEIAHATDEMPHANTVNNNVFGNHFYNDYMWGEMNGDNVFYTANGWERWRRGWMDTVYYADGTQDSVEVTLGDFITKGEALRIKIPGTSNPEQFLWLENHQGISVYDQRDPPPGLDTTISATTEKGVYAYVSTLKHSFSAINSALSSDANGFKALHAQGNYDYKIIKNITHDPYIWYNTRHDFTTIEANPTGPMNRFTNYTGDINYTLADKDGVIGYNDNYNNTSNQTKNEATLVGRINGVLDFGVYGVGAAFTNVGQTIVGISNNPVLTPHQFYDKTTKRLQTIPLNGVEVKIIAKTDSTYTLRVHFNKTTIKNTQRFTGELGVSNLSNAPWDLEVASGNQLRIDKTGTPNRTTLGAFDSEKGDFQYPGFITPTVFAASDSGKIKVNHDAEILVQNESSFILRADAVLQLEGNAQLRIEKGSFFCVEQGAVINLNDSSVINLPNVSAIGINPLLAEASTIQCLTAAQLTSNYGISTSFLADAGNHQNRCASDSGYALGPDSALAGTLRWTFADGSSAATVLNDTTANNPLVISPLDSTTTFKLTVTNGTETDEDYVTITILESQTEGLFPNGSFEVDINNDSVADGWHYYNESEIDYASNLSQAVSDIQRVELPSEKAGCYSLKLPLSPDSTKTMYIGQTFATPIVVDTNEVYMVLADMLINQTGTTTPQGDFDVSFYVETEEVAKVGGATYQHRWNLSGEHSKMFDLKKGWQTYASYFVAGNAFDSTRIKALAIGIKSDVADTSLVETYVDNIRCFKITDVNAKTGTKYNYIRRDNSTTTPTVEGNVNFYDTAVWSGFGAGHYGVFNSVFLHEQNPTIIPNWNSKARYIYMNDSEGKASKIKHVITNTVVVPEYVQIHMEPNIEFSFESGSVLVLGTNSEIAADSGGTIIINNRVETKISKGTCLGIFNGSLDIQKEAELDIQKGFVMQKRRGVLRMDSASVLNVNDRYIYESGAVLRLSESAMVNFHDTLDIVLNDNKNPVPQSDTRLITRVDGGVLNYTPTNTTNWDKMQIQHTWNALVNYPLTYIDSDVLTIYTEDTAVYEGNVPTGVKDSVRIIGNGMVGFTKDVTSTTPIALVAKSNQSIVIAPDSSLTLEMGVVLNSGATMRLDSGSYYHIKAGERLYLSCGSTLIIEPGAVIQVDEGALVTIDPTATVVDTDSGLTIHNNVAINTTNTCGCVKPSILWASEIDTTTALLNWVGDDAYTYTVRYRRAHEGSWQGYTTLQGTSLSITNLVEGSHYVWEVKNVCFGSRGWERANFSTLGEVCGTMVNQTHQFLTGNSVLLSWDSVPNAQFYRVKYKASNASNWIYSDEEAPELLLSSSLLQAGTKYQWNGVTFCDVNVSNQSETSIFTMISSAREGIVQGVMETHVSPNPFQKGFYVQPIREEHIQPFDAYIYDANGVLLFQQHYEAGTSVFVEDETIPKGVLFLKVVYPDKTEILKLVKE